jgi:hypothetical protein
MTLRLGGLAQDASRFMAGIMYNRALLGASERKITTKHQVLSNLASS